MSLNAVKGAYSTVLLIFSIVIVIGLIFNEQTKVSKDVHPVAALAIIVAALTWLNMIEGGQGALVGLPPVDPDLYVDTHPTTHKCTALAHKGDNLDRYLMGRQFMVLLVVFVTNLSGAPLADAEVFGLPKIIIDIFLGSGVAMILMTAMAGQLNSQVTASHCMLDYINNGFAVFTLYVAMGIEFSGLLHCCYLVQMLFAMASGKPLESNEPPRDAAQNLFYWGRILVSLAILIFAFAVTLTALFEGQTTMWDGVPNGVAVILFFIFMSIVGMLEGMQIAFFAVAKLPKDERGDHPMARKTCELLFKGHGRNLPGFMIGRQVCVTMCFFIIARVTTIDVEVGVDDNIFGVSDNMQRFFNTGLLGALITTIVASITWQLVASAFPIAFLSNPLVYVFLVICLFLEATGICSGAWVLASGYKSILGIQLDEVYIGTPEERAAGLKPDRKDGTEPHLGTNVISNAPGGKIPREYLEYQQALAAQPETFSARRERILSNIKALREQKEATNNDADIDVIETSIKMEIAAMDKLNKAEQEEANVESDEEVGLKEAQA
eukprot:CAMPEP_0119546730 /NCGR_PEP_ID=MMETSP1352-20130426/1018_1 /TAXON_ID=265584 /ORGANISM="Stauroneis constricta, Strain CCMP1120" /LENGTH=550 /DNA_ID=CAMNT_0007591455 /DNA_START=119 /DNA_END=1771 /DNA_ORIENTATION=+